VNILQALVLGIVQGITEWLPVSSTAHLVLVPWVLGWEPPPEHFLVLVQDGTLLAVVLYFRRDLLGIARAVLEGLRRRAPLGTPEARLGWWILLGTVPGAAVGLAFRHFFRDLHGRPVVVAWILLGATAILFLGERLGTKRRGLESLSARDALAVGTAQAVALFPGVSRSAATIAGGLLAGLDRTAAARFSFLLSIPILAGVGVLETVDLLRRPDPGRELPALAAGFLAAAAVGYAAIHWLLGYVARRPLTAFAWYRIAAGLLLLGLALGRG
jgi:undecaprenyl-diphosphatase